MTYQIKGNNNREREGRGSGAVRRFDLVNYCLVNTWVSLSSLDQRTHPCYNLSEDVISCNEILKMPNYSCNTRRVKTRFTWPPFEVLVQMLKTQHAFIQALVPSSFWVKKKPLNFALQVLQNSSNTYFYLCFFELRALQTFCNTHNVKLRL